MARRSSLGWHTKSESSSSVNEGRHVRGQEALQEVATSLLGDSYAQVSSPALPATPAMISENTGVTVGIIPIGFYALNIWSTKPIVCCLAGTPSDETFYSLARRRFRKSAAITIERSSAVDTTFQLNVNSITIQLKYHQNSLITKWSEVIDKDLVMETVKGLPWESRESFRDVETTNTVAQLIAEKAYVPSCFEVARDWTRSYGFESHLFGGLADAEILALTFHVLGEGGLTEDEGTSKFLLDLFEKQIQAASVTQTAADLGLWKVRLSQNKCAILRQAQQRTLELLSEGVQVFPQLEPQWRFFLTSHERYIRIDLSYWGSSAIRGGRFVRAVEHAIARLQERLIKRYRRTFFHAWPRPFRQQVTSGNEQESFDNFYAALYVIGCGSMSLESSIDEFPDQDFISTTFHNGLTTAPWDDTTCSYTNAETVEEIDASDLALDAKIWGPIPEESRRNDSSDDDDESDEEPNAEAQAPSSKSAKAKSSQPLSGKFENLNIDASGSISKPLRPALDILHRIQYDANLDSSDYIIGYLDRHAGVIEMPLDWWVSKDPTAEEFIPQSRIRYFKRKSDGEVVWDREERKDIIFGSGKTK